MLYLLSYNVITEKVSYDVIFMSEEIEIGGAGKDYTFKSYEWNFKEKKFREFGSSVDVVLIAYAISAKHGSEPGAGWAILKAYLENNFKVLLITTSLSKEDIEGYFSNNDENSKYYPNLLIQAFPEAEFRKCRISFPLQVRHLIWNFQILRPMNEFLDFNPKAIFHYTTYSGDWNLNVVHLLKKNARAIWGPVGGSQRIDLRAYRFLGLNGIIEELIRVFVGGFFRFPIKRLIAGRRMVILAANEKTERSYIKTGLVIKCHNIVVNSSDIVSETRNANVHFWCGRLIPLKNCKLAIDFESYLPHGVLIIAGDGPELDNLIKYAKKKGIEHRVRFLGNISRSEVLEYLRTSDAFIFTSLRDSASWALAEAVQSGIKIIALDTPGNRAVTQGAGIHLVPIRFGKIEKEMIRILGISQSEHRKNDLFSRERLANSLNGAVSLLRSQS